MATTPDPAGAAPATPVPAAPAAAPAPVAAAPAASPPAAPPPPPSSSTSFAPWGAVPSLGAGVTGWYTNVYLLALAYLAVPILVAAWLNASCHYGGIWAVLLFSTLLDLWVMFHPWGVGGVSFAGYLRGQIGGQPNLNIEDGVNRAKAWLDEAARVAASTILAKQIGLIWLIFFPIRGFGGVALATVALIILVVIGVARFSTTYWFARLCWKIYITLLVGLLSYWALAGTLMPELRHSRAHAVVTCLREDIRDQNDADLKGKAEVIAKKMAKMDQGLSEEERVATLSKEERAIWDKAVDSGFFTKSVKATQPVIGQIGASASSTFDWIKSKPSSTPSTAAGEVNKTSDVTPAPKPATTPPPSPTPAAQTARVIWQGDYVPSQMRMVSLGNLTGRYRVTCDGGRSQTFFYGGSTPSQEFVMDCQGGYRATKAANGMAIQASPPRVNVYSGDHRPDSTRPYGEIIAMVGSQPVAIAQGQCNDVNGEVQFGLNIRDKDYQHTTGVLSVKAESC